jgi:hypothetical protein
MPPNRVTLIHGITGFTRKVPQRVPVLPARRPASAGEQAEQGMGGAVQGEAERSINPASGIRTN